ncbi:PREDICTED: uncharacterized protein LOC104816530 [Tarenaya hassleriana]|uniref:uncharacterized protein LOC104816530 n=1 Tax=Tarenaya hassleriana TaxID=28532 RepID=UPI00053C48E6|nr:PREDICTED: uncharacterized protein LOC104816530 [Tarenaya hassleriana]
MAEAERLGGGIVLSFPAYEEDASVNSSPKTLPRRLRRRLLEPKSSVSAKDIDAKLRDADLRRQQYYESLSSKARPKTKSPTRAPVEDLSQRLEAKLSAAEQKRLSILEKELARLAKLDEIRQAAKMELEQRFKKERDELETRVEARVQKAARNRMLRLKAVAQQRAARRQRVAQSLMQKAIKESRYKERVRAAIHQKRVAAERKRLGLLEAERRNRLGYLEAVGLYRVCAIADSILNQREMERRKMKDRLEDRLQKANKLRAQYLRQRRGLASCLHQPSKILLKKQERLARMVERCWRRFTKYKKSTLMLARSYRSLGIDEKTVEAMPFELLALQLNSIEVIRTMRALLERLEMRFTLSQGSSMENINNLLKHFASPTSRGNSPNAVSKSQQTSVKPRNKGSQKPKKIVRYPARVLLCAYMIRRHPDAVFRGRGENEIVLAESAADLIREFELLMKTILDRPATIRQDSTSSVAPCPKNFRSQLGAFDEAWCSYLRRFVVWKVHDAKLLEEDLARTREPEQPIVKKPGLSPKARENVMDRDMDATQKQIGDEHKLTGRDINPVIGTNPSSPKSENAKTNGPRESLASSSFSPGSSSLNSGNEGGSNPDRAANSFDAALGSENEHIVNEIIHDNSSSIVDSLNPNKEDMSDIQVKVKETMEKAFWDSVMDSLKQAQPDFSWVLKLMKEVRDELCEISPKDLRQEVVQTIDTNVLSQLLGSGNVNVDYLGNILEFALDTLRKLSAPVDEEEIRTTHGKLMKELREMAESKSQSSSSFAVLVVKGLRFVLQRIQVLKKDISKARLKTLEPLLKGPAGLEYLKKAFSNWHGSPDQASSSLPLTKNWLISLRGEAENEWKEHTDFLSALESSHPGSSRSQGLPPTTMRTGSSLSAGSRVNSPIPSAFSGIELSECKGETVDLLIRLGLVKLVREISGLTLETLPETLQLNLSRLRAIQSHIQKIIVVSISVLILQQTLVSENSVTNPGDMEIVVSRCVHRFYQMLDTKPDAGLAEITETVCHFLDGTKPCDDDDAEKLEARKRVVASMLVRSLQARDPIFSRVAQTVHTAIRAAVLSGDNPTRKKAVEVTLRRIGVTHLSDKVIEVADSLAVVATVTRGVHGSWYEELMKEKNKTPN